MVVKISIDQINSLRFEGLSFSHGPIKLFSHLTLDLSTDQIVWINGERGQGQSTFLRLLAVMFQPVSGKYLVNEYNTSDMSFEEFMPIRLKIGMSFDYGGLFANRTLYENLILGPIYHKLAPVEQLERDVRELADEFGLHDHLDERPASVPGGLRKLTCVLRPLLMKPEMLVMDDPVTGLDSDTADLLYRVLTDRWASGKIRHMFFSSRDRRWAEKFSSREIKMSNIGIPTVKRSMMVGNL